MTQAVLPGIIRGSRVAFVAAVLLALLVTVVEVPQAVPVTTSAPVAIA